MSPLFARYPALADGRLLGIVAAVAIALVSLVAGGDAADARPVIVNHR